MASDFSEAMCFVVTFRGHISSVFNHRDRTLNCPDGGPPPTCPFIQPTMRKSDTGHSPGIPGFGPAFVFRGRRRVSKETRRRRRWRLMGRSKNPVNNFLSDFCRMTRRPSKVPAPPRWFNPLKPLQVLGAFPPPLLVWLAKHRSARRPGVVI